MNSIKLSEPSDVEDIRKFINDEWKDGHILSRDLSFFKYEFENEINEINFVISKNEDNQIDGILGFKQANSDRFLDIWPIVWKVSEKSNNPMLGVELLDFLMQKCKRSMMSAGLNKATLGIYKFLGISTGVLDQYYILNPNKKIFTIAEINDNSNVKKYVKINKNIIFNEIQHSDELTNIDFDKIQNYLPKKDQTYLTKRYFNHPVYKYRAFLIQNNDSSAVAVVRKIEINNAKVIRIVDFIGEEALLLSVVGNLINLLETENYEYVDFLCAGFNKDSLLSSGFSILDVHSSNVIIPNYFEPFYRKNIEIYYYYYLLENKEYRICKADGDQDRPS